MSTPSRNEAGWVTIAGLSFALLFGSGCGKAGSRTSGAKRFDVEACRIEYTVTGELSGTEQVWISDWGAREARWATNTMSFMGQKVTTSQLTLLDNGWLYIVALNDGTGIKQEMPQMGRAMKAINSVLPGAQNGKKIGTDTIAGRECEVLEFKKPEAKIWMWNNIPLKTEVAISGKKSVTEAVLVEENPTIPDSAFTVPDGITWTEM